MSKITPPLEAEAFRRGKAAREGQAGTEGQASQRLAPWHPVPTRLVDAVMPRLRDTELRVLLVVLRQTWGWKVDPGAATNNAAGGIEQVSKGKASKDKRQAILDKQAILGKRATNKPMTKRRDWLSHRQLCRRTGRGSDAVSAAVASLTASGLIIVEDIGGKPLTTPEERRRCLGRLYFRPGTIWLE